MARLLILLLLSALAFAGQAREAAPAADDPAVEAQMMRIASELRCLVCQNQTIADSNAALAIDLREQVREMVRSGQSESQIVEYMTARYGDFVLYRPPLKASTVLLWVGPALMLLGGVVALIMVLRRRNRLPPQAFDAEEPEPQDPHLS